MGAEREKFGSRIGFILVSAGCAVGLGNVWRFPYLCGQYGGAAFIIIYLVCLALIACPILICEISVGRASERGVAGAFRRLEPAGTKWHHGSWMCVAGNYLLMMFYTAVCGWMAYYFFRYATGDLVQVATAEDAGAAFGGMLSSPGTMIASTLAVIAIAFGICSLGLQKGVEKVSKFIMSGLFVLLAALAVNSVMLPGADAGIEFYLVPDFGAMLDKGLGNVLFAAMSQAFFTLSIGIGAMTIFGSYVDRRRSLTGEGVMITVLDTVVAVMSGLIIIPACFAFGVDPGTGPSLVFVTMPEVFARMPGGQVWGTLFFLFMTLAALSTVVAVFENIISFVTDSLHWTRRRAVIVNILALGTLSLPCILGFNVLSDFHPLGGDSVVLDLEDFLVSNNLLPLGALVFLLFCVSRRGWGLGGFVAEVDSGEGPQFPKWLLPVMRFVLPPAIVAIYLKGYYDLFAERGTFYLVLWMGIAVALLGFVAYIAFGGRRAAQRDGDAG